ERVSLDAVSLVEVRDEGIGPRPAGSPQAAGAAEAVAEAFAALGLEPRFQEFPLLGYEAEEPELEVDGERIPAGPCVYSQPSDGWVEGRIRRIGRWTELGAALDADAPAFAVEDGGREVARLYGSPFGGGAIPFVPGVSQLLAGPTVFVSAADPARLEAGAPARRRT